MPYLSLSIETTAAREYLVLCGLMTDPSAGLNLRPLSFSTLGRLAAELELDKPFLLLPSFEGGTAARNESCARRVIHPSSNRNRNRIWNLAEFHITTPHQIFLL